MKKVLLTFISILTFCTFSLAQNKENLPCPTITVVGPSALVTPGDDIIFTAAVDTSEKLEYGWIVSQGEIKFGQNTFAITIPTTQEMSGSNLTATVEIKGLPENCAKMASETAVFNGYRDPFPIDEYENLSFKEEKARLANIADAFKTTPDFVIYFISHYPENTDLQAFNKRISNVKKYLIEEKKISPEKIVFVFGGNTEYRTKIYLMPSNANYRENF